MKRPQILGVLRRGKNNPFNRRKQYSTTIETRGNSRTSSYYRGPEHAPIIGPEKRRDRIANFNKIRGIKQEQPKGIIQRLFGLFLTRTKKY